VRVLACVVLLLASLLMAGCSTFGKKSATASPGGRASADMKLAAQDGPAPAPAAPPPAGATLTAGSGILAGQILDNYNRRPPPTYIQVSADRDAPAGRAAPIEVAADKDGYFLIQGLEPGRHYQLIARARDGTQLMAGATWATPPNPRVVIRISQDLANASTPPLPGNTVVPQPPVTNPPPINPPANNRRPPNGARVPLNGNRPPPAWPPKNDQAWAPGRSTPSPSPSPSPTPSPTPGTVRPPELGQPQGIDDPARVAPAVPLAPDRMSQGQAKVHDGVPLDINGGPPRSGPYRPPPTAPTATGEPPPIPFCSLTGRVLSNFALYDLNGQPWEWRQRNNRLTLIDFWGSWCVPCLHAIPHLNALHERYGSYGLEVVGIDYEYGSPQQQAEQAQRVAGRLHINYTLLMGGDRLTCPVRNQFRVAMWPTLFLVDQNGRIIWQESGLDKQKLAELDKIIQQNLRQGAR
jgi:thiol-disulfide isomerase/thioredoxin